MKTLKNILLLFVVALFITSCEREFDLPPIDAPITEATISIKDLVDQYRGKDLIKVDTTFVIAGRVTANDISGNIYKQIQLQDATGGITISIDRTNIYNDIRVGQEIVLSLKGFYYGEYGTNPQLGNAYSRNNDGNFTIGQMAWEFFRRNANFKGAANPDLVKPITLIIDSLKDSHIGKLVTITNVSFEEGGKNVFAEPRADGSIQTVDRTLVSAANPSQTLTARNSSAANFAAKTLPAGTGSVTGVLSVWQQSPTSRRSLQITFRDSLDCSSSRFEPGNGTQDAPWGVNFALNNQTSSLSGWIEGFIVGTVAPGIEINNPIRGDNDIIWSGDFMNNTIVLAASADVKDWQQCVVIELPDGSAIRNEVNLRDNPSNWRKKLSVKGELKNYLGAAGLKTLGTVADFDFNTAPSVTILKETFGSVNTALPWPAVAEFTGFSRDGIGAAQVTYTTEGGAVSIRSNATWNSGASGGNNAMMAATGASLLVNRIATCGATTLRLSFGCNETSSILSVAYRISGTSQWINIPFEKATDGWGLISNLIINLPEGTNTINLRFSAATSGYGTRVDDISITTTDTTGAPIVVPD